MFGLKADGNVMVYNKPVSMHKSFDGLSALVQSECKKNPTRGGLFVFFNRARDKVKILYYDRNGFCQWYKRLERGRFPALTVASPVYTLQLAELNLLLEGIDLCHPSRFRVV